jgi:GNAT superfamily N-acetyltransferase
MDFRQARDLHFASWKSARSLGEEPHLEWSFVWHRIRHMLLTPVSMDGLGQQYFYEPIREFDTLLEVGLLQWHLNQVGAPDETLIEVEVGFNVFDSIYRAVDGRLTLPREGEAWRGRHSVVITGWVDDRETLTFRNTWGERWGDSGYGYMSREYFDRYADHASVSMFAATGIKLDSPDQDMASLPDKEWLREYIRPRPRVTQARLISGREHDLVTYRVLSMDWSCPCDILELWTAGRRWAWAHLYHPSGHEDRRSVLRELFVSPAARRHGLARSLVDEATAIARREGSRRIVIEVQEADGHELGLARARAFASAVSFADDPVGAEVRPVIMYRGSRTL